MLVALVEFVLLVAVLPRLLVHALVGALLLDRDRNPAPRSSRGVAEARSPQGARGDWSDDQLAARAGLGGSLGMSASVSNTARTAFESLAPRCGAMVTTTIVITSGRSLMSRKRRNAHAWRPRAACDVAPPPRGPP